MFTYCILRNNNDKNDYEIVETGFSFLAFIFGPAWGLFKKLWIFSLVGFFILFISKFVLVEANNNYLFFIFSSGSSFFWGFFARDLYIQKLINNNFSPIKHINAKSKENALIKYLSEENDE